MKYILGLTLILLAPAAAWAGDLTLFGSFHYPRALTFDSALDTTPGVVRQAFRDPEKFGVYGVRLSRANTPVGLEHSFAYSPRFIDSESSAFIYNTNLLVQTRPSMLQPYATAGAGVFATRGEGAGAVGAKFQFNYGGGIKTWIGGSLGVRVDVRGYSIRGVHDENLRVLESSVGILIGF